VIERNLQRHLEVFHQGVDEILPEQELVRKLERAIAENRPLRIKQGFDPTAPDIHLGHTVGLRKLRDLQQLGHQIILIVGDYTAQVGDPSGRSRTRPRLTPEEVEHNARTYMEQFFKVIRPQETDIRHNGEWFSKLSFHGMLALTSQYTVARILERDDFAKRFKEGLPIGVHELLYPLMQGWDSVEVQADVEIGGTDQKFNLLVGRTLQEANDQEAQVILTLPLLVGLDGEQRMSKSLNNYVGVAEEPGEQFGKLMSIPDRLLGHYWTLAADVPPREAEGIIAAIAEGSLHPMEAKKQLAGKIVTSFHGASAAEAARQSFERQFSKRGRPTEVYEWLIPVEGEGFELGIKDLLVASQLARSGSEAWRKVAEGAVAIDGNLVDDRNLRVPLSSGSSCLLRLGRRWVRIVGDVSAKEPIRSEHPMPLEPGPA
jgi:tyrosyl-tRNA synthetase